MGDPVTRAAMHIVILPAKDYYNNKGATGVVLLANGQPYHYPGRNGRRESEAARDRVDAAMKLSETESTLPQPAPDT